MKLEIASIGVVYASLAGLLAALAGITAKLALSKENADELVRHLNQLLNFSWVRMGGFFL